MWDDFSHLDSTPKCSITNVNVIVTTTWARTGLIGRSGDTFTLSALRGQKCSQTKQKPPQATMKTIIEPGPVYLNWCHHSKLFWERSSKCKSGNIYGNTPKDTSNKLHTKAAEQSPTWKVTRERRLVGKVKQLHIFCHIDRNGKYADTRNNRRGVCVCVCVGENSKEEIKQERVLIKKNFWTNRESTRGIQIRK